MQPLKEHDPDRISDYRLIGRLGEGGMGVVYLARSSRGRMVAVKTIRAELAEAKDFRQRFAKETVMAQRVGGEWTAAVLAADPDAALPWVATAYVAGPTLQQVVTEQHGPLPEYSVRGLASGLSRALGDIHRAGLIHRDLKPSNVMVTIEGPRVIDFGIARALDSAAGGLTSTGVVIGSPGFMAPEQVRGERLTEASDIFSLGTVLAFAASGRLPFDAPESQLHALMYWVVHEPPDLTGIPEPLLGLIQHCLAKDPKDRPALAELRDRVEPQYPSPGVWLPPEVLAQLGQQAVQLLDQEDPRTRLAPLTAADAIATAPTAPSHPPTTPSANPEAPTTGNQPRQGTSLPGADRQPGTTQSRLADERRRARGRTGPADGRRAAVYWLLALFAVVSGITAVQQIVAATHQGDKSSDSLNYPSYPWYDMRHFNFDGWEPLTFLWVAQILLGAGLMVCWLIWFARVRLVAERFAPGRLRYHPSMAVLSWFIPVANLFLPHQIANDVWHASSPPEQGEDTAPRVLLHTWWALWLVTLLTSPLFWTPWWVTLTFDQSYIEDDPYTHAGHSLYWYEFKPETWINLSLHMLAVLTAAVTALYVRRLTDMQAAKLSKA
ncbi:protein kinase [Streptomyces mauvecolor]|uniref:Protein kinase n=1 Tax=Streptomyces mauvecolor TaxID=58345 RepID=A0ABV9UTL7_9ACTN